MKKTTSLLKQVALLGLFLCGFSMTGIAANKTITITLASSGITSGGYDSGQERTWTQDNVSFGAKAVMKNTSGIQAQASNGVLYNTTPLPGNIVSIAITQKGANQSNFFGGSTARLVNDVAANYDVTGGTAVGNASNNGWDAITFAGTSYTYFAIKRAAKAEYWQEIVITYNEATTAPTINALATPLLFSKELGSSVASTQTISVSGENLTTDISLAISGTDASLFSITPATLTQVGGSIAISEVTANYLPTAIGNHTATLTLSSAGAASVIIPLNGSCALPPLGTPVISAATNIVSNGFTANWEVAANASQYSLELYSYEGRTLKNVLNESFDGCAEGKIDSPSSSNIANPTIAIDKIPAINGSQWSGATVYQAGGALKIGGSSSLGSLTTPTLDLSANGGAFTVTFDAMAWNKDATSMYVTLDAGNKIEVTGLNNSADYTTNMKPFSVDFTGGTATSSIKFEGKQVSSSRFFIDNVVIKSGNAGIKTTVTGSPFTTVNPTYTINGLASGTEYFYTITAIRGEEKTVSTEASVKIDNATDITENSMATTIYAANGKIYLTATAGEIINIYNHIGQLIRSVTAVEGSNEISISTQGFVLIKVGEKVTKVIL